MNSIKIKDIDFTYEEAREAWAFLNKIFGDKKSPAQQHQEMLEDLADKVMKPIVEVFDPVSPNTTPTTQNPWDFFPTLPTPFEDSSCLHRNCSMCHGTGTRQDGLGACIHMMSCSCKRCSVRC